MRGNRITAAGLVLLTALATVGAWTAPASAAFVRVATVADTYSNPSAPASNFGKSCCLAIGGAAGYTTFLRFQVPADAASATLTLSVNSQSFAGSASTFKVSEAGDGWDEVTLTNRNKPLLGAQLATFMGTAPNGVVTVSLGDVTRLAGQQVTLALSAASGTDDLWLWAREQNVLSKTAALTVTLADSSTGGGGSTAAPRVGVLGDSITQGCCSETTGTVAHPYWEVTANLLGWAPPVTDAVGGSGYVTAGQGQPFTSRIGPFLDANPDLQAVVVQGGNNDTSNLSALPAAVDQVFDTITSKLPGVRVYVLGPYSPDGNGQYAQQRDVIQQAAAAHGFFFVDQIAEGWMVGRGDLLFHDGFHPNDGGQQLLGQRFAGDLAVRACKGCLP